MQKDMNMLQDIQKEKIDQLKHSIRNNTYIYLYICLEFSMIFKNYITIYLRNCE
jgi:hypothetical protein